MVGADKGVSGGRGGAARGGTCVERVERHGRRGQEGVGRDHCVVGGRLVLGEGAIQGESRGGLGVSKGAVKGWRVQADERLTW